MKKWLAFILILVVMAGSFYPCCTADNCEADEIAKSEEGRPGEDKGICSPFFACTSCPGFVQAPKLIYVTQSIENPIVHYEQLVTFTSSIFHSTLFQPPRIC